MTRANLATAVLASAAGTLLGCAGGHDAGDPSLFAGREPDSEVVVTLDQVPAAVRATISNNLKGATIEQIERDAEDGKVNYDVIVHGPDGTFEMVVAEDGTFVGIEDDEDDDHEDGDDDDEDDDDDDDDEGEDDDGEDD